MRVTFYPPAELAMIATATFMGNEKDPTVELALYKADFDPGDSDGRLTGESDFGHLKARQFFPSSGCGVMIKDGKVIFTEPGLQNYIGKAAMMVKITKAGWTQTIIMVWDTDDMDTVRHLDTNELREQIATVIFGLSLAFT
jgi:hypothetical protein